MRRRQFLQGTTATAVVGSIGSMASGRAQAASTLSPLSPPRVPEGTIDTNVYLSHWPFRRLRGDQPADLVQMLRSKGVAEAWVGSFDGLTHADMAAVNDRLAEQCQQHGEGMLVPFGCVNPLLPDWEEDLRRCHEEHRMPGIRLHPNYHQYALDYPVFERLLRMATERGLIVQLAVWMEDERHQNPLMPVATVDLGPLPELSQRVADLRLLLLNGFSTIRSGVLLELMKLKNVHFDMALAELIDPLREVLRQPGAERLLFGSYSPMFYFDAAPLKLHESALSASQIDVVCRQNARRLLGPV